MTPVSWQARASDKSRRCHRISPSVSVVAVVTGGFGGKQSGKELRRCILEIKTTFPTRNPLKSSRLDHAEGLCICCPRNQLASSSIVVQDRGEEHAHFQKTLKLRWCIFRAVESSSTCIAISCQARDVRDRVRAKDLVEQPVEARVLFRALITENQRVPKLKSLGFVVRKNHIARILPEFSGDGLFRFPACAWRPMKPAARVARPRRIPVTGVSRSTRRRSLGR